MRTHALLILLVSALPPAAASAEDADLRALRDELAQLRATYEKRIDALEQRLAQAERGASTAAAPAAVAATGATAFNPEMSLILAGTYTRQKLDPTNYQEAPDPSRYHLHGFMPALGEIAPPRRGFGLGESELAMAANIDPNWHGKLTLAIPSEGGGAEVEEAFIQSLGLGGGLTFKAGRFLSGIGYMNEQHAHVWDFADAPLAYKTFLANQLRNDGVQLKWLAPTDLYLELGAEVAGGGAFPSSERNKNGATLGALFAHIGGDLNIEQSWRAGLSALGTRPRDRAWRDLDGTGAVVENSYAGTSRTLIADAVWKWAPNGNAAARALTVQGEYFRRRERGGLTYDVGGVSRGTLTGDYGARQGGGYVQGVFKFQPNWRIGYRYDRLDSGTTHIGLVDAGTLAAGDFPLLSAWRPTRHAVMLDHASSEFARFRVQFARDASRYDFAANRALPDNQVWLQYVVSLGAHGAHKY